LVIKQITILVDAPTPIPEAMQYRIDLEYVISLSLDHILLITNITI